MHRCYGRIASGAHDPHVWTRRALQEKTEAGVRSCTNVSGLVLELMLRTIMEIRAHPTSLAAMPRRAMWVISSRMRWEDHFSISSFLSQTSGGENDRRAYITFTTVPAASRGLGYELHRPDVEVATAMENAPGNASDFVGERNCQLE